MIREALAFHYMDDLDSKARRCPAPPSPSTPANPNGPLTAAPSVANFLRLDQFLKSTTAKAEENLPNPKLFQVMRIDPRRLVRHRTKNRHLRRIIRSAPVETTGMQKPHKNA